MGVYAIDTNHALRFVGRCLVRHAKRNLGITNIRLATLLIVSTMLNLGGNPVIALNVGL